MSKNVQVLKHFESPKDAGVYYRLVCLTGASKGEAYFLKGSRIVLGRSDKADVVLKDTKASREHAEITKVGDSWVVTDLGSQNGIMVNEKKVTQKQLVESDKLIIGQTVFKFARVEVAGKVKQVKDDDETPASMNKKSFIPVLILAILFMAVFIIDDDKKPTQGQTRKQNKNFSDVTADYESAKKRKQAKEDKLVKEKLAAIYQRGQREAREGNYFRAIHEFNLALIISPGDSQADFYLRKTKEKLDSVLEDFAARAQRDEVSIKYQSAIVAYCQIVRLLYTVPEDPRYKSAEERIKKLEGLLGLEPGETDCLKKQRTDE